MTEETTVPLDIKFQQRFSKNLVSNIIYFILSIIVGLALVPFFLDSLGDAAYALVPLATSVTSYVTLIVQCLNMSVSRYLTLDLQRGDLEKANVTFNTAMFGTLVVVVLLLPISIGIALVVPFIFSTGGVEFSAVFALFVLVFLSALIRTWTSNFQVTVFAYNRLDLWNWVNSSYLLVQVAVVVVLFLVFGPSLPFIGVSYLVAAIIAGCLAVYFSKSTCPQLKMIVSLFNWKLFSNMGNTAGWLVFQELGTLLKLPVCLILVNILFGAIAETEFSLAQTFITLLISISGIVTAMFRPQVYSYVAKRDNKGAEVFISKTMKLIGLMMALPISLLCVFAPEVYSLWIGPEYIHLTPLVWLLVLIPVTLNCMGGCVGPLNVACNKVKMTAIANFIAAMVNIALALSLPYALNIGMYGVALAWVISMILYCIFAFMYNAYIINSPLTVFLRASVVGVVSTVLLFICGLVLREVFSVDSIISAILLGVIIAIAYYFLVSKVILQKEDKMEIRELLPLFIEKKIPNWLF